MAHWLPYMHKRENAAKYKKREEGKNNSGGQ